MTLKFPKEIIIMSHRFKMVYEKDHAGGSFSFSDEKMVIGVKGVKTNPEYTFGIISHEIMEAILQMMGGRYADPRMAETYHFNFGHQTFENAIQIHADIISRFIKTGKL